MMTTPITEEKARTLADDTVVKALLRGTRHEHVLPSGASLCRRESDGQLVLSGYDADDTDTWRALGLAA